MFKTLTYKPFFWIALIGIASLSIGFTIIFFPQAFPIVHLKITMDRSHALKKAEQLTTEHHWEPQSFQQAAIFSTDTMVKTFVELAAGGKQTLTEMIDKGLYYPYYWQVRHFNAGEIGETIVRFTPEGTFNGFICIIPEDAPGAQLKREEAQQIAEQQATEIWHIPLSEFHLIEASQESRPNGRIDHAFIYERSNESLGEGNYRLRLSITGDLLSEIYYFVHIPENFSIKYQEMRSANESIADAAHIAMQLLYVIGGCIIGLFYLLRHRFVMWWPSLLFASLIAFLSLLDACNQFPQYWMHYDTALPMYTFFLNYIAHIVTTFIRQCLFLCIIFLAAEGLTRKAFGSHIRLWNIWNTNNASSWQILGRTLGGYLAVPIMLACNTAFYIITTRYLGWWIPAESLYDPNILATYMPWLNSIVTSLNAGCVEECLFRAVPLASAALIGSYVGGRRWWIAAAFLIQIIIFGAAHANYPMQPSYARLVELIMPSCVFGALYLYLGLLPAIIAHYFWDVIWIALPLFIASGLWAYVNQLFVIVGASIPLLIVLYTRLRHGKWHTLTTEAYNNTWKPIAALIKIKEKIIPKIVTIPNITTRIFSIGGIIGLILWFLVTPFKTDVPVLEITRTQAIADTYNAWKAKTTDGSITSEKDSNVVTPQVPENIIEHDIASWYPLTQLISNHDAYQHIFIWQTYGPEVYHTLLNNYLDAPTWTIHLVRFQGTVEERAENFLTWIDTHHTIIRMAHNLPESTPGETITEEQARVIAHKALHAHFNISPDATEEISATPHKQPHRLDWEFTFRDKQYDWPQGQARITIHLSGSQVTDYYRFIHVPETWERQEKSKQNILNLISKMCGFIVYLIIFICILLMIMHYPISLSFFSGLLLFIALLLLQSLNIINGLPQIIAHFNTSEPFANQLFQSLGMLFVRMIMKTASITGIIMIINQYSTGFRVSAMRNYIVPSLSLGIIAASIYNMITKLISANTPLWPYLNSLTAYAPWYAFITEYCMQYIMVTMFICISTIILNIIDLRLHHSSRSRCSAYILTCASIGLLLASIPAVDNMIQWLCLSAFFSIMLYVSYFWIVRYDMRFIPLITASYLTLSCIQQAVFNAYSGVIPTVIATCCILWAIAYYWIKAMKE